MKNLLHHTDPSLWAAKLIADEGDPDRRNILTGLADLFGEATKSTFDILKVLRSSRNPTGASLHLGYAGHRKLQSKVFVPVLN
jgi:hypothetical protein